MHRCIAVLLGDDQERVLGWTCATDSDTDIALVDRSTGIYVSWSRLLYQTLGPTSHSGFNHPLATFCSSLLGLGESRSNSNAHTGIFVGTFFCRHARGNIDFNTFLVHATDVYLSCGVLRLTHCIKCLLHRCTRSTPSVIR